MPEGYPDNPLQSDEDKIIKGKKRESKAELFFASVDLIEENEQEYILKMSSSRSIALVGIADTIEQALQNARTGIDCIEGKIHYRKDIGTNELIQKRIDLVNSF